MFNRSYQRAHQAVREAGGGHQVAADFALRLPWAGIFEPWREFVLVGAVGESLVTPKVAVRPKNAATRCKKGSGWLQGVQLELFPDMGAQKFTGRENLYTSVKNSPRNGRQSPANQFPPLAPIEDVDDERPLFDLFPDAYV